MGSTAGICPIISTIAQTQCTRDPEDGWVPTDTTYELYEENNGYRGPGRPHGTHDSSMQVTWAQLWILGIQTHDIQLIPVNHRL